MIKCFKVIFILFCLFFNLILFSQNYDCNVQKNWFFGRGLTTSGGSSGEVIHMQFDCPNGNFVSAVPITSVTLYGNEGTAVVNDLNTGSWQLYSDGDNVIYSGSPSINGLGGDPSSAQSVAIAPINICPVDSFYIFSNPTGAGNSGYISYSLGTGSTSLTSQGSIPMPTSAQVGNSSNLKHGEGMLIIPNSITLGSYWLITRLLKNNGSDATDAFVVYEVSSLGVSIHQVFNMNTDGNSNISNSTLATAYTNFTFNLNRKEIAVADANSSKSIFTIDFDPGTGYFSGSIGNIISLTTLGGYDSEYSPNNQYLYYSRYSSGEIFSYDLNTQTSTLILQTSAGPIKRGLGLATGPDGNIYALTMSTANWSVFDSELWQITNPNSPAPISTPFMSFDNWLNSNLPNFVVLNEFELYSNIGQENICPNDSLKLGFKTDFSLNTDVNFSWYLDGVEISGATDSVFWVQTPGVYIGEVIFSGGCTYESIEFEILPSLDLAVSITSYSCISDTIEIEVCNISETPFTGDVNVSFYDSDPLISGANILQTDEVSISISSGDCQYFSILIPLSNGELFIVLNDPGTLPLPIILNDFPLNGIEECDYENNISDVNIICCPSDLETVDTSFCNNDPNISIVVDSVNNGMINWYSDSDYTELFHSGTIFIPNDSIGNFTFYVSETSNFCTVLDSINLSINQVPIINAGIDFSICENDTIVLTADNPNDAIITWDNGVIDGQNFISGNSQTYIVSADLNSCSTIDSIYVDILPVPTIISNLSETICEGDSILITLSNPENAIITWNSAVAVGEYIVPPLGVTAYIVDGDLNNCINSDTFEINVNIIPIIDAGMDFSICENDTIVLTADNPNNALIIWNNGIIDGQGFLPGNSQTYVVTANLNSCITIDSIYVDILPVPTIVSNLSETICEGDSILITLSNPENAIITWSSAVVVGEYIVPPLGVTTYSVSGELNSCINSDTFQINVSILPLLNLDSDIVTCQGLEISLSGNSEPLLPLIWSDEIQTGVYFSPNIGSTYYTATVGDIGCSSSDSILVTVNPNPDFSVQVVQPNVCGLVMGQIEFTELNNGFGSYSVNGPNGLSSSLSYDSLGFGTYVFLISDENGCEYSNTITLVEPVSLINSAEFMYSPLEVTNLNSNVTFQNLTNNAVDYFWYNSYDNSLTFSEDYSITFPPVEEEYEVCLVANFGGDCVDTACVFINVIDELLLFVPNAFTPDGDETNNKFTPIFSNSSRVADYHLVIFNRWGEILFESYDQTIGWDSRYAGRKVQDGVYIWQIEYRPINSSEKQIERGHITVLK